MRKNYKHIGTGWTRAWIWANQ